jgi:hypothetical protein
MMWGFNFKNCPGRRGFKYILPLNAFTSIVLYSKDDRILKIKGPTVSQDQHLGVNSNCNCNCNLFAFRESNGGYNPEDVDIVNTFNLTLKYRVIRILVT